MMKEIGRWIMSHKKIVGITALLSMIGASGFDYANASTGTSALTSGGIYFATFVVAGIVWSLSGFINGIRAHANYEKAHPQGPPDPDWRGFNPSAMKDDVFIGLILGAIAFVMNSAASMPNIGDAQTFIAAVLSAYGLIGLTDKVAVGAILNR